MKHIWFLGMLGAVGGGLFYVHCASLRNAEADPLDDLMTLSPAPAAIYQEITAHAAEKPPMTMQARQDLFAERFTQRFRLHEPKMAVRARFVEVDHVRNRIKLMCPARMEPWNMDRLALCAWRESKHCLGEVYDIDLYETFIGAAPRKVGELRATHDVKPIACIHYLADLQPLELFSGSAPGMPMLPTGSHVRTQRNSTPSILPVVSLHP